jgi:DNA-directed RNA polymerase specialized sigma24 family protein
MDDHSPEELLRQYLAAAEDTEADHPLGQILEDVATPLVRRIVASVVRDSAAFADAEDIVADTLMDLLRRLRDARGDASHPIHDLRRYVVTCAYNRCHERLRERYPARNRLRNQLRYLCNHDGALALWRGAQGEMVCGFREWMGREAGGKSIDGIRLAARSDPAAENRAQVAALVPALLREVGGPVGLDALTAAMARLIGVEQQRTEVPLTELEVSGATGAHAALEERVSLRQLWDDVRKLAWKQRVALLLNLRDAHGRECLSLLPLTRTATIAQIAEVVGMPAERFAMLWNDLPLTDAAIGKLLEATPRQVIKLRRLARERLRRMARRGVDQNLRLDLDSSSRGITILTRG